MDGGEQTQSQLIVDATEARTRLNTKRSSGPRGPPRRTLTMAPSVFRHAPEAQAFHHLRVAPHSLARLKNTDTNLWLSYCRMVGSTRRNGTQ